MRWKSLNGICCFSCLLAAICWLQASGSERAQSNKPNKQKNSVKDKKGAEKKATGNKAPVFTAKVEGWGKTVEDAEKHAIKNARTLVESHLHTLRPPIKSTPSLTLAFVGKKLLTGPPELREDQEETPVPGEKQYCWVWTVNLTAPQLENLRAEDATERAKVVVKARSAVAEARLQDTAKLAGWFILVLAALWTCVRVGEWTQSAGRTWLRIALACVVVGGGVGLWFFS